MSEAAWSRSETVMGYALSFDRGGLRLRTVGGDQVTVWLTDATSVREITNLGESPRYRGEPAADLLEPGMLVITHGPVYEEAAGPRFTALEVTLVGSSAGRYAFERPGWWIQQLTELAAFYRHGQFGGGAPDFRDYRTQLLVHGGKSGSTVQETDTLSRLVYGMASGFMLTGDESLLAVAEAGSRYQQEHMRFIDTDEDMTLWYHAVDLAGPRERKLLTSVFDDDRGSLPAYEQIYALVGLVQTYRITGDPALRRDIEATVRLFRRRFADPARGGYWSHLDPVTLRPDDESLGRNRMRKNWNSVGDHAPAYLFNLYLATGDLSYLDMLEETFDLIVTHFPDPDGTPLVRERFHADWSPDATWGWQQDRAVVGHDLKISWNLTRMNAARPKPEYRQLAASLAATLPAIGRDPQRGGWYDVIERSTRGGRHDFAWHDRKAWWQQEQAILAYLVHAGHHGPVGADGTDYLAHAREAEAFYNAFFLDRYDGGVHFAVLAGGEPFVQGNERHKGSHSMSMYHAAELCYLATVYDNLLVQRRPLDLWFAPLPDADYPGGLLRVAPDVLPSGRVHLTEVTIDERPYHDFDPYSMTIRLPHSHERSRIRARLTAVAG